MHGVGAAGWALEASCCTDHGATRTAPTTGDRSPLG